MEEGFGGGGGEEGGGVEHLVLGEVVCEALPDGLDLLHRAVLGDQAPQLSHPHPGGHVVHVVFMWYYWWYLLSGIPTCC